MSEERRSRGTNFTPSELELLLSLVEEHKNIVECKKVDSASNKQKQRAWKLICQKFNFSSGTGRTPQQLRTKWKAWKKTTRKRYSTQHDSLCGDGISTHIKLINWGERVLSIMNGAATSADTANKFDSDSGINNDTTFENISMPIKLEDQETENSLEPTTAAEATCSTSSITEAEMQWQQWSPASLKEPVHSPSEECSKKVQTSKRKRHYSSQTPSDHSKLLTKKKLEFMELQIELMKREHELKEKREAEKHEMQKKEHELNEQRNSAKHELELVLMRAQINKLTNS